MDKPKEILSEKEIEQFRDQAESDPPSGDDGESRAWQTWTYDVRALVATIDYYMERVKSLEKELSKSE